MSHDDYILLLLGYITHKSLGTVISDRQWCYMCDSTRIPVGKIHEIVDEARDIATASLIETWIDETERRVWFLFESSRHGDPTGH